MRGQSQTKTPAHQNYYILFCNTHVYNDCGLLNKHLVLGQTLFHFMLSALHWNLQHIGNEILPRLVIAKNTTLLSTVIWRAFLYLSEDQTCQTPNFINQHLCPSWKNYFYAFEVQESNKYYIYFCEPEQGWLLEKLFK